MKMAHVWFQIILGSPFVIIGYLFSVAQLSFCVGLKLANAPWTSKSESTKEKEDGADETK